MASKKITLLTVAALMIGSLGIAQTDFGWDWKDSSKVSVKDIPQYNEFLNNQFPYPAKPKSMTELSFGLGEARLWGSEVVSNIGFGGFIGLRKAINHTFSARLAYFGQFANGTPNSYIRSIGGRDYRAATHSLGFDIIANLNTASYYRANPKTNFYVLAGFTLSGTRTRLKNPTTGEYQTFYGIGIPASQTGTMGSVLGREVNGRRAWSVSRGASVGVGFSYKITDKYNVGIEQRLTFTNYDYFDGFKAAVNERNDAFLATNVKFAINLGNPAKKVQPLYWINPNNFAYSELNAPKHMKMPKVVLPDADGDGVTDQFDLQPNTPAGAPVDSKGVAKDTDGDGVPDFKDKELLTPQSCFPVNNDGVGSCPEPSCCKEIKELLNSGTFVKQKENPLKDLPSITFDKKASKVSGDNVTRLESIAQQLRSYPDSKIKLIGYGASSKAAQQLSWERVNAVRKYLIEKLGIAENRIIFTYGLDGDPNTVDIQGTTEDGPSTVPAPHPNLKSKN